MLTNMRNIRVNPDLWNSYKAEDLRKLIYFGLSTGDRLNFKGSYYGRATLFSGLATNEMYLPDWGKQIKQEIILTG
ncbi:hypothetical protein [Sphingobacterium hotanense]|uniref:hypothetical protein n=1 Tax=Sphingobacterium hotanense TaxID=649196 RepID=UPI0021A8A796|nr:hypothetical protein [Sphingobacterium hotanense]MCT1526841.1 hypothetical protein [Sphingobacterium hotanense]